MHTILPVFSGLVRPTETGTGSKRLTRFKWYSLVIWISVPLLAQTSQPWGLLKSQSTAIEVPGGASTSPAGEIYLVGGNVTGVPTIVLGNVSRWSTFLLKEDIDGKVLFAVQIGGSLSIGAPAFDAAGNAYIIGNAADSGFATTPGAYQSKSSGGYAPFACKFRATDGTPAYCTFLPATSNGLNTVVDPLGNLYYSGHFGQAVLTTPGAMAEGGHTLFVGKLDPTGTKLIYQAAFGGSSVDYQDSMAIDPGGNVYLTGRTYSADFPVSPNAAVSVFPGKGLPSDSLPFASFVTKLNPTGSELVFSTFGGLSETPYKIGVNADNAAQMLVDVPATPKTSEKFLIRRFSSDGTAILFATNLNVPDTVSYNPPFMAIDSVGITSLFGTTFAVNFPTLHPTQSCGYPQNPDGYFGYLIRLASSGEIIQSTFLEGASNPSPPLWLTASGSSASLGVSHVFPSPSGALVSKLEILNIGPTASGEVNFVCVGNAASFREYRIAPYEIVSLFGQNLGPAEPIGGEPGPDARFPLSLGNTQVTFDGVPAPLLYVSANQINAVAPAGLSSKSASKVCVIFQSSQTNCIQAGVGEESPGIFLSGAGPSDALVPFAAAVNQDGTANSQENPAKVGSIVSIYATGTGMITPAPIDGAVVQLPLPTNQLALQVLSPGSNSNVQLTVLYAGPAPFEVAGITQINFEVPQYPGFWIQVASSDGVGDQSQSVQIWTKP